MARMTGFVFQDEYLERLAKLSDQEVGRLVRALAEYHATGKEQELAGREGVAFDFIRVDIDRIDQKYEARCETNRNNRQQSSTIVNEKERTVTKADEMPKDKVKDKVKDKDIYNYHDQYAHAQETIVGDVIVDPLIVKVQQELNGLTDTHYQALNDYRQELGDDLVSYAIDSAVGNGVRNWAYVQAILQGLLKDGIRSVGEAKARDEKRREEKEQKKQATARYEKPPKTVAAQRYTQRDYSEKKLENDLGVNDIFAADWDGKL